MTLSNKWYDRLKVLATTILPAIATLYAALASVWGLGYVEQVVATITAINTFLGAVVLKTSKDYQGSERALEDSYDGVIHVAEDPGGKTFTIEPKDDNLDHLGEKSTMTFRVQNT